MSLFRPIHHTFAPHVNAAYALRSCGVLIQPWRWKRGRSEEQFRSMLEKHFERKTALFSSGREALYAYLKTIGIKAGDEVIVQGYTCVIVPNAIHAAGGVPVYADIDRDTLNLTIASIQAVMTPRTRAIICQHTFGIPAETISIRTFCDENRLILIEDCAHVIPDTIGKIGKYGDAILLSFGRDKAISGITGGAMCVSDDHVAGIIRGIEAGARDLSLFSIKRYLLYPIIYLISRPLIGLGIGKAMLKFARTIRLLPSIVTNEEKRGDMSLQLHKMPNACCILAISHMKKLNIINDHRRLLTLQYMNECRARAIPMLRAITADMSLQKFPLFMISANAIRSKLKAKNIHLDDGWTGCVICPGSSDETAANYKQGSDPIAESACEQIVALPTHPTMTKKQAKELVEAIAAQRI